MLTMSLATDECFTCNRVEPQRVTRKNGQIAEVYCTRCGTTDSFPYDDED